MKKIKVKQISSSVRRQPYQKKNLIGLGLNKLNKTVELDTDGVNEQTIDVQTPEGASTAFEQKEEVDLGYTDVSGEKKTAKELLQEVKESEKEGDAPKSKKYNHSYLLKFLATLR